MAKIPFNVDAYTARLIGRENVSKLEGAVVELVKNTYDADATYCILYYDEKTDVLYLADNGYWDDRRYYQKSLDDDWKVIQERKFCFSKRTYTNR